MIDLIYSKGYSCLVMPYTTDKSLRNCWRNINRLSRCFFSPFFIAFVNELICKTIHSGGGKKRGKLRKFPCQTFAKKLLARFASYVDHINLVFYMLNDSFDLMTIFFLHYTLSLFGYVYSETSNEFVHNILMNLTDCCIQIAIYLL